MFRNMMASRVKLAVRISQLPQAEPTASLQLPFMRFSSNYAKPIGQDFDMGASFSHSEDQGYIRHSAFGTIGKTNQQIHRFVWQDLAKWQDHIALVCYDFGSY